MTSMSLQTCLRIVKSDMLQIVLTSLLIPAQVKNRESAARSRARKQEYTAQLEVQVAKLREENRLLLEKVSVARLSRRSLCGLFLFTV